MPAVRGPGVARERCAVSGRLWTRGGPAASVAAGLSRLGTWRERRDRWRAAQLATLDVLDARVRWLALWRRAAEGCELATVVHVAAGVTVVAPELGAVLDADQDDRPTRLLVRMREGQLVGDYRAVGEPLALALGCARVRVVERGGRWIELVLLDVDPLAAVIPHQRRPVPVIGHGEDGERIEVDWSARGHTVVQGQTGSGKSVWTYGQLAAAAPDPGVLVCGLDPTGLLWRPFTGSRHAPWQVSGLSEDLDAHVELLGRLVEEMDRRIAEMPADRDAVQTGPALPLLLVVLEEYAGLLRAADLAGKATAGKVRALVGRLLAEGRKAGVRLLLIVQRADAAVVDGLARAQCATRISFSVDSGEAVRMLHPAAEGTADLLAALPGVALLTMPGRPLCRFRAELLDGYGAYVAAVQSATRGDVA